MLIEANILSLSDRQDIRVTLLDAFTNSVFSVRTDHTTLVVKYFAAGDLHRAQTEYRVMSYLRNTKRAARPVKLITNAVGDAYTLLVSAYVPGRSMRDFNPSHDALHQAINTFLGLGMPQIGKIAGLAPAKMNPCHPEGMLPLLTVLAERCMPRQDTREMYQAALRATQWISGICTKEDWAELRPTLCHGDPGLNNVLNTPEGHVVAVDWEDAGWGDPTCELAKALLHRANQKHIPQLKQLIATSEFCLARPVQLQTRLSFYLKAIPICLLFRRIDRIHHALDHDHKQELVDNLDRASSIVRQFEV